MRARVAAAEWQGELEGATHHARASNPVCGDDAEIWLRVKDATIEDVRWKARGCPPTLAALDLLAERVAGSAVTAALGVTVDDLVAALPGLPATSRHACALAIGVLKSALAPLRG